MYSPFRTSPNIAYMSGKDYEDGESCAGGHQMASVLFGQVTATENKCQFEADMETHYNGSFITFDDEAALKECWLVII